MSRSLRVLILEDRREDALLMVHELRRSGFDVDWQRVESEEAYLARLNEHFDVILADYSLPQFDAMRALEQLQATGCTTPLIIVSGTIGEEIAVATMKRGASDYLLKDRLGRLGPAVMQVLEQKELQDAKRRADRHMRERERRFRALIEHSTDGIALLDEHGTIIYASPSTTRILGYAIDEFVGCNLRAFIHPVDLDRIEPRVRELLHHPSRVIKAEYRLRHKNGSWRWVEAVGNNLLAEPGVKAVISNYRDITERKEIEKALQHYTTRLQALSRQLAEVQEAERKLIAADLHDSVVQWLSGTLFRVEVVRRLMTNGDRAGTEQELIEVESALQHSIRELRHTITRLYPTELRRRGLVVALSQQVDQWAARHEAEATFKTCGEPARLPLAVETGLYRICQEALNNVARHAHATAVAVTLEFADERVSLTVTDNGMGIPRENIEYSKGVFWYSSADDDSGRSHIGLLDMCERTQALNGTLELQSEPGGGTTISTRVPL